MIFLDEIQECQEVITSLKFWALDNRFDVIASGSLLLQEYHYDIAHYATAEEKVKAEKCYLTLAKQLLDKENHKFQYKEVEHGGRAQKYFSSIEWLLRADMLYLCKLVTDKNSGKIVHKTI